MAKVFLQAEWRKLAMANYSIDKSILTKYLPSFTELDLWNDTCYVSLVGFLFKNTRIKGLRIPFHTEFEEINLRFYVRYKENAIWKRGVVFIKEIVPKFSLTFVANTVYNENYETLPTAHNWVEENDKLTAEYKWKKQKWNIFKVVAANTPIPILQNSEEEFITEHFWGYTKISDTKTSEYGVEHPRWDVYPVKDYMIDVDFNDVYGKDFAFLESEQPQSVFLAEGSEIKVLDGKSIKS